MSASGCVSKWLARRTSSSLMWRLSSAMMPTAARVVAANAAVTVAGAASCSVPRAARISRARAAILRCRPPRLSADWMPVRRRWRPARGWGPGPAPPGRRRGPGPRRPPGRPGSTRATRCAGRWCAGAQNAAKPPPSSGPRDILLTDIQSHSEVWYVELRRQESGLVGSHHRRHLRRALSCVFPVVSLPFPPSLSHGTLYFLLRAVCDDALTREISGNVACDATG